MSVYLKQFSTNAEYETYINSSGAILPNVSICTTEGDVHYNPYVAPDPYNGYEYVDLGLPSGTKWATMNVGASSVTDYGNYYMYGKGALQDSDSSIYEGTENPLATSADTAAQVMGGEWHMPTQAQLNELTANTVSAWTSNYNGSNVSGVVLTSTADTNVKLFLPAAGSSNGAFIGSLGYYWSSTPENSSIAYYLLFANDGLYISGNHRSPRWSVRGVVG